jgi:hypothetical protein
MISGTLVLIAAFTFAFSFSNMWGTDRWAAPLVALALLGSQWPELEHL